ncbi:class I SAM-dependent methyltransferase [Nocardioides yefusunii]|uniref:Class I SAM-dependent methyltransferase n=1 Tax=Nocardioides yefusunii TaxID=2500546 RepID=A0ABW1QYI2_9ACTN|nr:class I SAM-dependent methyltransferase [Nocardioides yefusunii]
MTDQQPTQESLNARQRAGAHAHGRPGHPLEVARWLVPGEHKHVLEVGAGIGLLTEQIKAAGHAVHAVDRDPALLDALQERLPGVHVTEGTLEQLDVADRSVDQVVCSTAFTSFDHETVLPVIARALRSGGHLSVVWHERDTRIPWVRRLGAFLEGPAGSRDNEAHLHDVVDVLQASTLFSFVEQESFTYWQQVNSGTVADLVLSRSWVWELSEAERAKAVAEVTAFYDDYGRGMDGMQLPYVVRCVRTQVVHQPGLFDDGSDALPLLEDSQPEHAELPEPEAAITDGQEISGNDDVEQTREHRGLGRSLRAAALHPFDDVEATAERPAIMDDPTTAVHEPYGGATGEAAPRTRYDRDLFRSDGTDTDMLLIDFR